MPLNSLIMLQLIATPSNALADEPVSIRAIGLPPSQIVTITATVKDEKENLFQSKAFYKANEAGEVDLEQASALGGDYVGVHPMGLFCCLKPKRAFQRLIKKDVMNSPLCICLDLYDSVCWLETVRIPPKASQIVHRWFVTPGSNGSKSEKVGFGEPFFSLQVRIIFVDTELRFLIFFLLLSSCLLYEFLLDLGFTGI